MKLEKIRLAKVATRASSLTEKSKWEGMPSAYVMLTLPDLIGQFTSFDCFVSRKVNDKGESKERFTYNVVLRRL